MLPAGGREAARFREVFRESVDEGTEAGKNLIDNE